MRMIPTPVIALAFLAGGATCVAAQQAATVSGHVTARGAPLAGAHVRIDELKIERTTGTDGSYSFVVPSGSVRGQSVRVVVTATDRRLRIAPATSSIVLVGGSVVKDFDLVSAGDGEPVQSAGPQTAPQAIARTIVTSNVIQPADAAGAVDVASVLAGRVPGLAVSAASVPGGSARLTFRGPRSILGSAQPLYVVDGIVADNTVFTSAAQRFGFGGFDYGSPVGDLDLANVESVRFDGGADAAAAYGGRAANGVVYITTKNGAGASPFAIFSSLQRTGESVGRLPTLQNQYGQGLNGQFQFFDGRGAGVNDATDQSWGPALDGRAVSQASYTEAGRPDVRLWTARPNNVQNYFRSGETTNLTAGVQGGSDLGSFRAQLGSRTTNGITPRDRLARLSGDLHGSLHPFPEFALDAHVFAAQTKDDNAPGTGFNVTNPVSQFVRMGRQVDTDSLKLHVRDATGKQVSWNYAGQNNPYFASLADSNYSHRYHVGGGATARYALAPWLDATAQGGVDYVHDGRLFSIGSGWMGGFPFYASPGDFSKGGSEGDLLFLQQNTGSLRFDAKRALAPGTRLTISAGADFSNQSQRAQALGVDSVVNVPSAGAPDTAKVPSLQTWTGRTARNALLGEAGLSFANGSSITATVRDEWSTMFAGLQSTTLYPAVRGAFDLARALSAPNETHSLSSALVHASWWRSGSGLTAYDVGTMYAGRVPTGSIAPVGAGLLLADSSLAPEVTTSWELGTDLTFRPAHATIGVTYYHQQTSGLIVPVPNALGAPIARNAAAMTNSGVEGHGGFSVGDAVRGFQWDLAASAAANTNSVDRLFGTVTTLALGPQQAGLTVAARAGQPFGVLLGRKMLRDPSTGALVLRNGLPLPDSVAGNQILGSAQPKWTLGAQSSIRYRWLTLAAAADGRIGGQVFSATNYWGSVSGTLSTTAVRPDSGLLLTGIDAVTHQANSQHVSTEAYYHALGAIQEPWVYSANFIKLRELRFSADFGVPAPLTLFQGIRASFIARNLVAWSAAPNIDPEGVFSPYQLIGVEMGQLPQTRTIGVQISLIP